MRHVLKLSSLLKLSAISVCALSLSGCAFTKDVAQIAYDNKAEKNCSQPSGGETNSIHRTAKSNCINGSYVPRDLSKYENMPAPAPAPKKSE